MGTPSIFNQVNSALDLVVMSDQEIEAYKAEHHVDSVKKALRPAGRPNRSLPVILGKRTKSGYLETCTKFFERARELTGKKLLADLFTADIVLQTLDTYYIDMSPATNRTLGRSPSVSVRRASRSSRISTPTTNSRSMNRRVTLPTPQPASKTRCPT